MLTTISKKLTDEEQLFKTIYLAHPDLHLDEWLPTPEQMAVIQDLPEIQQIYPQISPFFSNDNSFNEQIIPPNRDVHLMIHGRFFPCGIHSHDFFEITYVLKGTCTNYIAGKEIRQKTGDFCLLAPHTPHAIKIFSDETIMINILIRFSTFQKSFFGILTDVNIFSTFFTKALYTSDSGSYLIFETKSDQEICDLILRLYQECDNRQPYTKQLLNSLITTLFILLLCNHQQHLTVPNPAGNQNGNDIMFILNYVISNYKTLTLHELSVFFNYSERQMARILHDYTGKTFLAIIRDIRLQKSCELLQNPDIPISEIINEVGYSNTTHFYTVFKAKYHTTPSLWREQYIAQTSHERLLKEDAASLS